ncbi:MAG: transcription elongation factor GreA [Candidatus Spechtbacteria bacterium]|nr:transcription elongation factor GreA [Candidatus Spechtbacteria bacterium]
MANILTKDEYNKLKAELERLYKIDRPQIAKDLKEAISQGDLSENAAYADAKERQRDTESRVRTLEKKLAESEIVEEKGGGDTIHIGSTFRARDEEGGERVFSLVGPQVSSPKDGKISFDSPIGKAFLDKKQGEEVEIITPGGKRRYTVLEILGA